MAKTKKNVSDKENEYLQLIADTKKKLKDLQSKRKIELGELAYKCGLNEFDSKTLKPCFEKLAMELKGKNK